MHLRIQTEVKGQRDIKCSSEKFVCKQVHCDQLHNGCDYQSLFDGDGK